MDYFYSQLFLRRHENSFHNGHIYALSAVDVDSEGYLTNCSPISMFSSVSITVRYKL